MTSTNAKNILLIATLAASLSACDNDDNSSDPTDSTTSSTLIGLVDSVSESNQTVTVNGYTLQAATTPITYEDNQFELSYLTVGTQVEVEASAGSATEIELTPAITGIVSELQDDSLVVNGITFSYSTLTGINVGDWVMISAQMQSDDSWVVSAINIAPTLDNAEVEGRISALDESNATFNIGSMLVDYSAAYIEDAESLSNGQWVEVEGSYISDRFNATEIELEDESDYDGVEMEGTITWVNSTLSYFEIDNRTTIQVTSQTIFEDGTQNDLIAGSIVDVEMHITANGLVATEIEFENKQPTTDIQEFSVQGIATTNESNDTLTINGVDFIIDATTRFKDGLTDATLDNVWLEIEGVEVEATDSAEAHWLIKEIESDIKETTVSLAGPVSNNSLWHYNATDNSLAQFNDSWVDVECTWNGDDVSDCRLD